MTLKKTPKSNAPRPSVEVTDLEIKPQGQSAESPSAGPNPKGGSVARYKIEQAWPKKYST